MKRNLQVRSGRMARVVLCLALALPILAQAQLYQEPKAVASEAKPSVLANIGIDQHLDQQLPLDLKFRDESGNTVPLGKYFGKKPVIFTMVYYTCPMLCGEVQNGLTGALTVLRFNVGKEFDVVSVSINPAETPQDALNKKKEFLRRYRREGAAEGWHFLTGDKGSIDTLAKAAGFRYNYDPQTGQYAHGTAIMVVTPQGKMAQYFYGIEYSPNDLRLALVQASENHIGNLADAVLLYCYHYDPHTGRYSAAILNIVRLSGLLTVFGLGAFLTISLRRESRVAKR